MEACCLFPVIQTSLKERFEWIDTPGHQWQIVDGGRPCTDCGVLVEGMALYFGGGNARQAITVDLDLRGAKLVSLSSFAHQQILLDPYNWPRRSCQ